MTLIKKAFVTFSIILNFVLLYFLVSNFQKLKNQNPVENVSLQSSVIGDTSNVESDSLLVTKVIDGDTIVLSSGKTVRYIGIDAPETSRGEECFANGSTAKNMELVLGKDVRLEKDVSETDRYGRLLRYVYVGDVFVNEYLVMEGFATVSTYPPDVAYSELFKKAEKDARENNRGLWGECKEEVSNDKKVPEASKAPEEKITIDSSSVWECSSNTYNCSDFKTQAEAQTAFETCGGTSNDVHKLDRDNDGKVCESLP